MQRKDPSAPGRTLTARLSRLLLRAVTAAAPVAIAACYGAMTGFEIGGHVIDRASRATIGGIQVTCEHAPDSGGGVIDEATSGPDGAFTVWVEYGCDRLVFTDVDGDEGGGRYRTLSVPAPADADPLNVALTRE